MVVLLLHGFRLQLLQVVVELLEALAPRFARVLRPSRDLVERRRTELTRPALCIPTAGDQPRALEHLQMPRDGWKADLERSGELEHRRLTRCQARDDGPPGGIGERGKDRVEVCGGHAVSVLTS